MRPCGHGRAPIITILFTIILLPFVLWNGPAYSSDRTGALRGRVVDDRTGKPVAGANVILAGTHRGDATDADGWFLIEELLPGRYTVVVQHQGYRTVRIDEVVVQPEQVTEIEARLELTVIPAEAVVVTASRSAELEHEIPQLVSIASEQEIRSRPGAQIPEVLREEMGVFIQKTNQGGGSPILRGLKANKVLLLVDGIRMNNSTYRGGNMQYLNTIDPYAVERIEVVHGPVSTLYGSDALGGVVHVISRDPTIGAGSGWRWRGHASASWSTADETGHTSASVEANGPELGVRADVTFRRFGDVRRGRNGGSALMTRLLNDSRTVRQVPIVQSPNGYRALDGQLKMKWRLNPATEMQAAVQFSDQPSVPRYDVYEVQKYDLWKYEPQRRTLTYLKVQHKASRPWYNQLNAVLSYHHQQEARVSQKRGSHTRTRDAFSTGTLGLQLQLNKLIGNRHFVVYGAELYVDRVAASSESRNLFAGEAAWQPPLFPDGSRAVTFGMFVQSEWNVSERLKLDTGGRISAYEVRAPFDPRSEAGRIFGTVQQTSRALTGSLGLRYLLTNAVSWVVNVAQGFRAPNLDDLSKLGPGKGGSFYDVPNPDLQPEKALSLDTGLKVGTEGFRASTMIFYNRLTDLLVRRPGRFAGKPYIVVDGDSLPVFYKVNAGKAYTAGVVGGFEAAWHNTWRLSGSFSYVHGWDESHDEPLAGIPPLSGLMAVRRQAARGWWEIYVRFAGSKTRLAAEELEDLRIPEGGTPGWWTLNLRGELTVSQGVAVRLGITNVLDRNYREHLSGYNAPGRSLWLMVELNF